MTKKCTYALVSFPSMLSTFQTAAFQISGDESKDTYCPLKRLFIPTQYINKTRLYCFLMLQHNHLYYNYFTCCFSLVSSLCTTIFRSFPRHSPHIIVLTSWQQLHISFVRSFTFRFFFVWFYPFSGSFFTATSPWLICAFALLIYSLVVLYAIHSHTLVYHGFHCSGAITEVEFENILEQL